MKRVYSLIIAAAVIAWAVPSFALVDGEVYGGLTLGGDYKLSGDGYNKTVNVNGWGYGARAHLTGGLIVVDYGIGGFYQQKPLDAKIGSTKFDVTNTSFGGDCFLRLGIIPVVKPYVRAGLAFADYVESKASGVTTKSNWKGFNSYYTGFGVGLALPIPVVTLMVFGEYLYNHQIYSGKLTGNNINFGISLGL
jgi:hypothetical protein